MIDLPLIATIIKSIGFTDENITYTIEPNAEYILAVYKCEELTIYYEIINCLSIETIKIKVMYNTADIFEKQCDNELTFYKYLLESFILIITPINCIKDNKNDNT